MTPDAFLQAIRAHPREDGPRLVYADWLEERGECDRAEFIRVQCELEQAPDDLRWQALTQREAELLAKHRAEWLGPWQLSHNVRLRRGFLEAEIRANEAARLSPEFWQTPALLDLAITNFDFCVDRVDLFTSWPGREFVTRLEPDWYLNNGDWSELRHCLELSWPRLESLTLPPIAFSASEIASICSIPNLRRVQLRNVGLPPSSGSWRSILSPPVVERVVAFELHQTPLSDDDVRELASACNRAANLAEVNLRRCGLGAAEFKEFIRAADLRKLRRLGLDDNPLRDSGIRLLAEANLPSLTELSLNGCECGKPGVQSLLDSGLLRRLSSLHLNNNFLGDAAARVLLAPGELESVERFSLGSDLTDNGLGFIANNPAANRWSELTVQGSTISAAGLLALLRSTETANLSRLTVFGLYLHLGHLPNLNRKPFASRLRELTFGHVGTLLPENFVSRESVVNLLSSPSLKRLQRLRVPSVTPMGAARDISQRFGCRFECDFPD